jgi:hypothetical protein
MTIHPYHDENTASSADEAAIRDLFQRLLEAWGRGDKTSAIARFDSDAGRREARRRLAFHGFPQQPHPASKPVAVDALRDRRKVFRR